MKPWRCPKIRSCEIWRSNGSRFRSSCAGNSSRRIFEEQHNAVCTSPRTCFRSAFRHGVIDNDPFWIELTVLRNYTVHTYNQQLADYVYARLAEAARRFRAVLAVATVEDG